MYYSPSCSGLLKWSRNKKDLNDVTAATFLVSFSQLPVAKKNTKKGAAVTSLRSFLFCDDSRKHGIQKKVHTVKLR